MALDPQADALENTLVTDREHWLDGPPHGLFKELRRGCPVHWTSKITEYPREAGFWSVTKADHVHAVSRDWETYSSERGGITALTNAILPLELSRAMFIGMDPPKHDRLKALFQAGFTPRRIAEHEDEIGAIWAGLMNAIFSAGDPEMNPEGVETVMGRDVPQVFERCRALIAERRARP